MNTVLLRFLKDDNGATAVEYGLILTVLSLAIVGGVSQAFNAVNWLLSDDSNKLANAFAR